MFNYTAYYDAENPPELCNITVFPEKNGAYVGDGQTYLATGEVYTDGQMMYELFGYHIVTDNIGTHIDLNHGSGPDLSRPEGATHVVKLVVHGTRSGDTSTYTVTIEPYYELTPVDEDDTPTVGN